MQESSGQWAAGSKGKEKGSRACLTRLPSSSVFNCSLPTARCFSDLELALLQKLLDIAEELFGVRAVDDAVVEGQREVGHLADGDVVVALGRGDDFRALLDCADAEDGDLRLV